MPGRRAAALEHGPHIVPSAGEDGCGTVELRDPQCPAKGVQPFGERGQQRDVARSVGEIRHGLLGLLDPHLHFAAHSDARALQWMPSCFCVARVASGLDNPRGKVLVYLEQRHGDVGQALVQTLSAGDAGGDAFELRGEYLLLGAVAKTAE